MLQRVASSSQEAIAESSEHFENFVKSIDVFPSLGHIACSQIHTQLKM